MKCWAQKVQPDRSTTRAGSDFDEFAIEGDSARAAGATDVGAIDDDEYANKGKEEEEEDERENDEQF